MASLLDFVQAAPPAVPQAYQQTLSLSDLALQRDDLNQQAGINRALVTRNFETRTIPGIVNRAAGRGTYHSGGTAVRLAQAGEDVQNQLGQMEFDLQRQMQDIIRSQYLATLGVRL